MLLYPNAVVRPHGDSLILHLKPHLNPRFDQGDPDKEGELEKKHGCTFFKISLLALQVLLLPLSANDRSRFPGQTNQGEGFFEAFLTPKD